MSDTTLLPYPETNLTFFFSLITGKFKPGKLWYDREYRIKYLFRSLAVPTTTWKIVKAITGEPVMRDILPVQHTLPSKIHRPYLYSGMPTTDRADAIINHYRYVKNLPVPRLRQAMLTRQGVDLITFTGKSGETFTITLACTGRCEREGEVNLLFRREGVQLAMLTFAVTESHGQHVAMIGGIQGAHRDTPHELIREATKACYGLFPKRLLMETLSLICTGTGIEKIEAVSDNGHIFRSLRYRLKKRQLFHASYNEFWETLNAQPLSDKLYSLPLRFPRKPLEEIASKKRSEYRKRYELLDAIQGQFSQAIA
ncbi:VirK/YbjX family protein [Erwinia pyri]|uniref:VirK/YbjX family protein n=1 Tax=Erwinia pyri TaxID=3062598 RepID=A0AA50DIS3_9GAMM|nr:VirK/YbjX family protein [Erwinia sp. DE2]WLS78567.1 VirK/YbjX family protein [Erwinia sp. DE2]